MTLLEKDCLEQLSIVPCEVLLHVSCSFGHNQRVCHTLPVFVWSLADHDESVAPVQCEARWASCMKEEYMLFFSQYRAFVVLSWNVGCSAASVLPFQLCWLRLLIQSLVLQYNVIMLPCNGEKS